MAIDLAGADAYFAAAVHPESSVWLGFTTNNVRTAGVVHAKAVITRLMGEAPDETLTTFEDFPRPDAAVYEQALFELRNGFVATGDETTPKWTLGSPDIGDGVRKPNRGIAPEARRWLFSNPALVMSFRGC